MTGCLGADIRILEARSHLQADQIAMLPHWQSLHYLAMGRYRQELLGYPGSLLVTQPLRCENCRQKVAPESLAASLLEV